MSCIDILGSFWVHFGVSDDQVQQTIQQKQIEDVRRSLGGSSSSKSGSKSGSSSSKGVKSSSSSKGKKDKCAGEIEWCPWDTNHNHFRFIRTNCDISYQSCIDECEHRPALSKDKCCQAECLKCDGECRECPVWRRTRCPINRDPTLSCQDIFDNCVNNCDPQNPCCRSRCRMCNVQCNNRATAA